MSTEQPTRVFRYGEHAFDDPGATYSTEQVRLHLATFFPELSHASTEEELLENGRLQITFRKRVATKGCVTSEVLQVIGDTPACDDHVRQLWQTLGDEPLTLATLLNHETAILTAAEQVAEQSTQIHRLMENCCRLEPVAGTAVPRGF